MVNSYRYVFAASVADIPSSGTTVDLGIGQIGVFDGSTYQATAGVTAKSIVIAQGTPSDTFPAGVAKGNFTYKTDVIKGNLVKSWKRALGTQGHGMITTMGFDGVDTTKGLTVPVGAENTFTYWVTLSGTPIANLLGNSPESHYAVWTEQFTTVLPCTDECADSCGAYVDQNIVADAAIAAFNSRKIIGGQPITDYVKVTKLIDCETPSGIANVSYTVYTLTIPDSGDQAALGKVQSQYPTLSIKRISREDIFSTYEVTKLTSDGAPAAFSNILNPVVSQCDSCPSGCPTGYTSTVAQDVYVVQRPLPGTTDLTTAALRTTYAETLETAYSATASEFLSFNGATASVKLYFTAGATVAALLSDQIVQVGTNVSICTQTYIYTTAWKVCKPCIAAQKSFVISIANSCDHNYLTELQAIYGAGVTLVSNNTDTCVSQFSLLVESDNKDCDACDDVKWEWTAPKPFQGLVWTEVAGVTGYGTTCITGLKFESVYEQRKAKECFLKQVAYEFEPLFITVSTRNPDPNNFAVLCETDVPVTLIQNVKYPRGLGRIVADQVIASNYQFNQPWRKNPAERDAFLYELGIDLQGTYDQYILEYVTIPAESGGVSGFGVTQSQTFELSVFFPQGTGNEYESIITAFVASQANPLVLEDIGQI